MLSNVGFIRARLVAARTRCLRLPTKIGATGSPVTDPAPAHSEQVSSTTASSPVLTGTLPRPKQVRHPVRRRKTTCRKRSRLWSSSRSPARIAASWRLSANVSALRPRFTDALRGEAICSLKASSISKENDFDPFVRRGSIISLPSTPRPRRELQRGHWLGKGI